MKKIAIKTLLITFFFSTLSCEKEEEFQIENNQEVTFLETKIISGGSSVTPKTKQEMEIELRSFTRKNSGPPHFAFNSGTLYQSFGNNDDFSNSLEFGNRVNRFAATQWVDYTLDISMATQQFGLVGGPYGTVPKRGWLQFRLDGVGQRVNLNLTLNNNNTNAQLKVSTTANFHEYLIQPSSIWISGGGPIQLTVHANTNGWMWVQIKQNNFVKFSAHYRFNTSTVNSSKSDGSIRQGGFGQDRNSYAYPTYKYTGYSGWF